MTKIVTSFQPILPRCKSRDKTPQELLHESVLNEDMNLLYHESLDNTFGTSFSKLKSKKLNKLTLYKALYWLEKDICVPIKELCCPKVKVPQETIQTPLSPCVILTSHCVGCGNSKIIIYSDCEAINHNIPFSILIAPTKGVLSKSSFNNDIFYDALPNVIGKDYISIEITKYDLTKEIVNIEIDLVCAGNAVEIPVCNNLHFVRQ